MNVRFEETRDYDLFLGIDELPMSVINPLLNVSNARRTDTDIDGRGIITDSGAVYEKIQFFHSSG
jgi:hypothetical protein